MSILDHPLVSARMFFPQPAQLANPFTVAWGGTSLACAYIANHPGAMTLLHFHGNGEVVPDYLDGFAEAIDALGFNLLLAEYPGYGASSGEPALVGMLEAGVAVFQALGLPPERVVVFGRSIGSLYAIHLAHRVPAIRGLILESAIAQPLERVLERVTPAELGVTEDDLRVEARRHLDHQAKLANYPGATLVLHTRRDMLVGVENAIDLHRWAQEPKELVIFDRGDHNSIMAMNWVRYMDSVRRFVAGLD